MQQSTVFPWVWWAHNIHFESEDHIHFELEDIVRSTPACCYFTASRQLILLMPWTNLARNEAARSRARDVCEDVQGIKLFSYPEYNIWSRSARYHLRVSPWSVEITCTTVQSLANSARGHSRVENGLAAARNIFDA